MEIDTKNAMFDAIRDGIKAKFSGYNSPLDAILKDSMSTHGAEIKQLFDSAITSCIDDPEFREQISTAGRQALAKLLVSRFGGELEKQVNVLKSDPTTRARITLAIEEIVKSVS